MTVASTAAPRCAAALAGTVVRTATGWRHRIRRRGSAFGWPSGSAEAFLGRDGGPSPGPRPEPEERASSRPGSDLPHWVGSDPARVETDTEGVVVDWNAAAERLYGYAARAALGRPFATLTVPARQAQHAARIREAVATGLSWEGEREARRRDGRLVRLLAHDAPRYDDRGRLVGFVTHSVQTTRPAPGPAAPGPAPGWRRAVDDALFDPATRVGPRLRVWLLAFGLGYEIAWALFAWFFDVHRLVGITGAVAVLGVVAVAVVDLWIGVTLAVVGGVAFEILVGERVLPGPFAWAPPLVLIWAASALIAGFTALRLRERAQRLVDDAVSLHRELEAALVPAPRIGRVDLSVAALYRPGEERLELGGDFYAAIERPDRSVELLVGDVSGHGPSAAALAAMLRAAWEALAEVDISPGARLRGLNRILLQHAPYEDFFATACAVVIDQTLTEATVTRAGHQPPILVQGTTATPVNGPVGVPLGLDEKAHWSSARIWLPPAFSLLLYTDGVVEGRAAPDSSHRFGEPRLLELLAASERRGRDVLEEVITLASEANGSPLPDDAALLLVERYPSLR